MRLPTARLAPLIFVIILIGLELVHTYAYLFADRPGLLTMTYYRLAHGGDVTLSDALLDFSEGIKILRKDPASASSRKAAAEDFKKSLAEFDRLGPDPETPKLPPELGGARLAAFRKSLSKVAGAIEKEQLDASSVDYVAVRSYHADLVNAFPNNGALK